MKKRYVMQTFKLVNFQVLFILLIFSPSCQSQNNVESSDAKDKNEKTTYGEHDKVTYGLLDKSGNIWFGTSNEGAFLFDGKSFVNFTDQDGLSHNYINCIVEDKSGILWFGTNDGLNTYNGDSFSEVKLPWDSRKEDGENWWNAKVIQCMLIDKIGNLWLGTGGNGLFKYDGEQFVNYSFTNDSPQSDGLHHNYIQSIIEDDRGNIWFTSMTHGGVSRFDGNEFTHFSSTEGLKDDMVTSSFQDRSGNLWFGSIQTKFEGLYRFNGKSFIGYGKEDGLCDNFVTGFFEDRNGLLWIRTGSILCTFDGKTFAPFKTIDGKGLNNISFIMEDAEQRIWLGGGHGQLWRFDGKYLTDYSQKN